MHGIEANWHHKMALTADIVATYRGPRRVMRRLLGAGEQESRALMFLMLACGLIFVGQWPRLQREAVLDDSVGFDVRLGGALLGWIFIMPLALYALALISHWGARLLGGKGSAYGARLALFWALLAASPLWLFYGLVAGLIGPGPALTATGIVAIAVFLAFWALTLVEAQVPA